MKNLTLGTSLRQMLAAAGFMLAAGSSMAWPVLPAAPCTGNNCLQYSDFSVYSLALINLQNGGSGSPTNGQAGYVDASEGQIKDYVVIGTGASNGPATTNVAGVDDAYHTTSGTFSSLSTDPTNGPGAGDTTGWQASIATLKNQFLNSNFVAFFSFAEPGSSSPPQPLLGADMLVWAKISAIDLQDPTATKSFYLQPNGSTQNNDPLATALPPDTTLDTVAGGPGPWVYVHSKMCVAGTTFVSFPDASGNCPAGTSIKDTNTGSNNASFAVYNAELDSIIHDGNTKFDILQVDWEMAYADGSSESLWIQPWQVARTSTDVPEPDAFALMGIGLVALALSSRRRRHAQDPA